MQKILFIPLLVFSCICLVGQTHQDSLFAVWIDETTNDTLRTDAFVDFINHGYLDSDPDSAVLLADDLIAFGSDRNYDMAISYGHELKGYGLYYQSKFRAALQSFKEALAVAERM